MTTTIITTTRTLTTTMTMTTMIKVIMIMTTMVMMDDDDNDNDDNAVFFCSLSLTQFLVLSACAAFQLIAFHHSSFCLVPRHSQTSSISSAVLQPVLSRSFSSSPFPLRDLIRRLICSSIFAHANHTSDGSLVQRLASQAGMVCTRGL